MRIQNKLFAIFFITSVVLVTAQVLVMQWSIGKGMIDYVNKKELDALHSLVITLQDFYSENKSWDALAGRHRYFREMLDEHIFDENERFRFPGDNRPNFQDRGPPRLGPMGNPPPSRFRDFDGPPEGVPLDVTYAILNQDKKLVVGIYSEKSKFEYLNIVVDEKIVGYLAVSRHKQLTAGYELNFVEQQQRYIVLIAVGLIIIALLVTLPLAHHFVVPIKKLTLSMSKLTSGQYDQRINLKRKDEFAQLTRDFNDLAATLEQNEQARKRWLADISHELRTPVAVLKGEMESMVDGVRPLSMERIQSSLEEVNQLEQLLNDLHELTRSDLGTLHYRKDWVKLIPILEEVANQFETMLSEKGIRVELITHNSDIDVYVDVTRLKQLFSNLLSNVGKYAVDGNLLKIAVDNVASKEVHIIFEDNGQGVSEQDLPLLFEHLFRAENSRNRETGGSGLGLSICKKIVEAHHGKISAFSSKLGGLGIQVILPLE
ncbi:ATP-binding protein [Paraglaciecola sp. 2405UD69-4]|uniref:ATP-binding protein n=1 Tax=Paraglaciecola sp. 2405UD69-4 TaxID=3391836 RepID=UPI0039C9638B